MTGNSSQTVRALSASLRQSNSVRFSSRSARPRWPPPISTVPLANCLNESLRPRRITTGSMKCGTRPVIISIGAITSSGTGSPSCGGDAVGPGARGVDDLGASNVPAAGVDAPRAAAARAGP